MRTARALRRNLEGSGEDFPQDVVELLDYFRAAEPGQAVRAVPGAGLDVPVWLLGSSLFSAQLAAMLGLPFAFASHFAPDLLDQALETYRSRFRPSAALARPYAMAGLNVFAAETAAEARRLFTSVQQQFLNLRRGMPGPLPPPVEDIGAIASPAELIGVERALACSVVGDRDAVRAGLADFVARTGVDEVMATAQIHDHAARRRSFAILAEARDGLAAERGAAAA
jgi:luciferase family oxidoreductase group 1